MNARDRHNSTLDFENCVKNGGAVLETFYPWDLTVKRFLDEGMPKECDTFDTFNVTENSTFEYTYFDNLSTDSVARFENYFGFDSMRRMSLRLPFNYIAKHNQKAPVTDDSDWEKIKVEGNNNIEKYYTDENIKKAYLPYKEGHENGEYSIRFAIEGFFWTPRDLFGIEEHMMALYDEPELLHNINSYLCDYYIKQLGRILKYVKPDVLYIMEDLSGKNGPMISPKHFDEYIGTYYKKLIPFLKSNGVRNVFVDTDGDFKILIPNFIKAGVDGFLPMDVNAGMDIVAVRENYPTLKFIGAYNKLEISKGKDAIDREFERIMPVIMQGGYIPGADHQVAPSTSLDDYKYYIKRLKECMKYSGANLGRK